MDEHRGRLTKDGIRLHEPADFAGMHAAGRLAAEILDRVADAVYPGQTTGELDRQIELSISKLVKETNQAVEADIKMQQVKQAAERKEAQRLQKLVQEQQRQRKKTLDELAMLDDFEFREEQKRNRELSANSSQNQAHDQIGGKTKKKRTLLSRVLPFGILRGTFRGNRRSDYL